MGNNGQLQQTVGVASVERGFEPSSPVCNIVGPSSDRSSGAVIRGRHASGTLVLNRRHYLVPLEPLDSEDEERQLLSIDAQISEVNSLARQLGATVVKTFEESKTAKEPGREVFNEMLHRIEQGEANAIMAWKLDRLARNFDDGGRIIGMLQRGAIQEIQTFDRKYLPTDNVMAIAVEFGSANQYVRDLTQNIRRGIREKIRRGMFNGKAPLGYYNEPRLRTIEPHPKLFRKVKRILEKVANGG